MSPIRGPVRAFCTLGSALLVLTGCDRLAGDESKWARAALERNPDLTIIAADESAKTFTVQVKGSNELRVVRVDQLIGTVLSDGVASAAREPAPTSPPVAATQPTEMAQPGAAPAQAGDLAEPEQPTEQPAPSTSPVATARNTGPEVNPGMPSGTGVVRNSRGEVIASVGDVSGAVTDAEGAQAPGTSADGTTARTGTDGKVLASGPGYTVSAAGGGQRPIRLAEATALRSPANAPVEHRSEPMVCQGSRLLHINGRNIEFEGDAVRALDGCEIHITNSHIIARGVGVFARAANVHIKNSIVEGQSGSVSASDGAKVYTQQSTFKGLSRRLDTATFHDLGGTAWN